MKFLRDYNFNVVCEDSIVCMHVMDINNLDSHSLCSLVDRLVFMSLWYGFLYYVRFKSDMNHIVWIVLLLV